jgi:7-carboxy-7-deazaguanine synthase
MTDAAPACTGYLYEIFSGIQGEGLHVGERQVFVRFCGCNLRCSYCDTPYAQTCSDTFRAEHTAGLRDFRTSPNPVEAQTVAEIIARIECFPGLHHSVVLTGGEPLMQPGFAACVASELKGGGFMVMLETNGSLPGALEAVVPFVDLVSMDVKVPASPAEADILPIHEEFLRRAVSTATTYIKIVLTGSTNTQGLLQAIRIVESVDACTLVILQPVTGHDTPSPDQMLDWQEECKRHLRNVRVIPQCHRLMGQL